MTPEQLRAHNMLTHTLWPEWEEYCAQINALMSNPSMKGLGIYIRDWDELAERTLGARGEWIGASLDDYEIAGELYVWIP